MKNAASVLPGTISPVNIQLNGSLLGEVSELKGSDSLQTKAFFPEFLSSQQRFASSCRLFFTYSTSFSPKLLLSAERSFQIAMKQHKKGQMTQTKNETPTRLPFIFVFFVSFFLRRHRAPRSHRATSHPPARLHSLLKRRHRFFLARKFKTASLN